MDNFSNNLLPTVNHLSIRLGPVIKLFDGLLERITPKTTAAACGGIYCDCINDYICGQPDGATYTYHVQVRYTSQPGCNGTNCWVDWGCLKNGCLSITTTL